METRIEAVLFDWGGVLIDNPASGLMGYCAKALDVSVEDYTRVHNHRGEPFQKGSIREDVFWRRVCDELGCAVPSQTSLWGEAFRAVYSPREEVFDLARRLRDRGYRTSLLSNTEVPAMEFFFELRYDAFDAVTFSCAEGVGKPQRGIYEIAAHKLGLTTTQCVFIDDKPEFVEGAQVTGMKGIVYGSLAQVERELADLSL